MACSVSILSPESARQELEPRGRRWKPWTTHVPMPWVVESLLPCIYHGIHEQQYMYIVPSKPKKTQEHTQTHTKRIGQYLQFFGWLFRHPTPEHLAVAAFAHSTETVVGQKSFKEL